jgi:hypothetical protein
VKYFIGVSILLFLGCASPRSLVEKRTPSSDRVVTDFESLTSEDAKVQVPADAMTAKRTAVAYYSAGWTDQIQKVVLLDSALRSNEPNNSGSYNVVLTTDRGLARINVQMDGAVPISVRLTTCSNCR